MQADRKLNEWLFEWRKPGRLLELANAEGHRLGAKEFLSSRHAKMVREAWVVGKVGSLIGVPSAKMSDRDPPDAFFELHDGRHVPVEVTELLQEGRRRGDEEFADIRRTFQNELDRAGNCNGAWLDRVITKKLARDAQYPPGTIILIYHNTDLYDWDSSRQQITTEFEQAAARKGANIMGSIILFSGTLYGEAMLQSLQIKGAS